MAQMKGMDICDIVVGPCHQFRSKLAVTKPLQLRLGTPSGLGNPYIFQNLINNLLARKKSARGYTFPALPKVIYSI